MALEGTTRKHKIGNPGTPNLWGLEDDGNHT